MPTASNTNHFYHQQSIVSRNDTNSINFINREPPPPYNIISHRRNQNNTASVRSRVEEYRSRFSVSDSDSEDDQRLRPRYRHPPTRVKNEILLGKIQGKGYETILFVKLLFYNLKNWL